MTAQPDTIPADSDSDSAAGAAAASSWGVVLLCHGSQRGASRDECSCAWAADGARFPAWCPGCPNTPVGLRDVGARLQHSLADAAGHVVFYFSLRLAPGCPAFTLVLVVTVTVALYNECMKRILTT